MDEEMSKLIGKQRINGKEASIDEMQSYITQDHIKMQEAINEIEKSIHPCQCGYKTEGLFIQPYGYGGLLIRCKGCQTELSNPDIAQEVINNWNKFN